MTYIYIYIKFNENPSSGCRVVPCGRIDMANIIDAFRNFANGANQKENSWPDTVARTKDTATSVNVPY